MLDTELEHMGWNIWDRFHKRDPMHTLQNLTPPSVSTDGCAPCHRFKSFAAPSVFFISTRTSEGRGVRDECQISTGGVS